MTYILGYFLSLYIDISFGHTSHNHFIPIVISVDDVKSDITTITYDGRILTNNIPFCSG